MGFGFAGAAAGGAKALEDIVAQRLFVQKLEAEIANRQKQTELEQAALNQRSVEHSDNMRARSRDDDRLDADRRDRNNSQGVRKMVGESLMQGGTPDRRALAAMQIEAGDAPTMLNEPKPERDPIADHEAKARIDARYRREPSGPAAPRTPQWVQGPDGIPIDINGVAPKGTKPYDPVAARSSQPVNRDEAIDTAREAKRIATALKDHKGFNGAFGVMDSWMPTFRQDTADAESLRDTLTSLLTMENMGKMKGVLSDSDMKILRQASSTVNSRISESAAKAELERIIRVMGTVSGDDVPEQPQAGGGDPRVDALLKKYGGG